MAQSVVDKPDNDESSKVSSYGLPSWAKNLKIAPSSSTESHKGGNSAKSAFARLTGGLGLRLSPKASQADTNLEETSTTQPGFIGNLTKGLVDSSKNAVKAVQVKARHAVSQNKRRYQEGGFDLDMTYITENIIAMGFPSGDMSSGFFGYVEGFYRNHMEEVIRFFESHHRGKYKVYNLCSERLYDASLFEGKVACFPFDDHNCPPIQLITLFCRSAYSWLKEDIENVVVVHCKAGMARTGLMISCLLLYLKFFPTAEESMDYYNQKRCLDGKGLVLPSQIRYVKYFERILTYFNGENQTGRRCMLRGFRLHRCPYWIKPSITISNHSGVLFSSKKHPRTKDLSSESLWFTAPKKGILVFALPGEPGLTEVAGDFKVHFHDRQGDFYCWLNTTMIENRKILSISDLDGFDKRKLPSPGFQVEVVLTDLDGSTAQLKPKSTKADQDSPAAAGGVSAPSIQEESVAKEKDDVFSDSDGDGAELSEISQSHDATSQTGGGGGSESGPNPEHIAQLSMSTEHLGMGSATSIPNLTSELTEFKASVADSSVFTFGDEDDFED